jgi:penicillin-binding protein 1A
LVVTAILTVLLLITGGIGYAAVSRDLPDLDQPLKGRDETSKVYDRNGVLITELFADQNRTRVPLAEIPVDLRNAVIAVEDERFYEHQGVDPVGILRALWVDLRTRSAAQGGSTITQQYVVNAFVDREDTLTRKVKEAILAYRLENDHSKDEILEMYLNTIYFGHGAYSVETASQVYFGKAVGDLSLAECATLAGVIKSPGTYSPYLDPDASRGRRGLVLDKMLEQGYIDQNSHDEAAAAEIQLVGLEQGGTTAPYFIEYVKSLLASEYGEDALYRGGLEVHTTLDLAMQAAAETAIAAALTEPDDPSAALVALEPESGEIRAMVGGRDFSSQQYNVAVQGRRQPGSAFKPFVLVTALEQGIPSEETFECGPVTLQVPGSGDWKVTGAYGGRTGSMRLREATVRSVNSVFAQLIVSVGADRVVETAQRMGITSDIMPVPAIALGGLDQGVSPLEMASGYGTLGAGGVHAEPRAVLSVSDPDGEVLFESQPASQEALEPAVAYLATDMLRGVISSGTGRAAAIGRDAAGKTGTTQEYRDAWFVGYTPQLSAAVWVGYPDEQREMKDVHGRRVTGGSFPAEIWAAFMRAALEGVPEEGFEKPSGLSTLSICADTGEKATEYCEKTGTGLFLASAQPGDCSVHTGPTMVDLPNMIGKTKEEAIALLNGLSLPFEVREEAIVSVPKGLVADQDPRGGSEVTADTVVTLVVSTGPPPGVPPTPYVTYSPSEPAAGDEVTFDGTGSTDDGAIVGWVWEIADEPRAQGATVSHVFETSGSYDVTLWVTDDTGLVESLTITVEVH